MKYTTSDLKFDFDQFSMWRSNVSSLGLEGGKEMDGSELSSPLIDLNRFTSILSLPSVEVNLAFLFACCVAAQLAYVVRCMLTCQTSPGQRHASDES